MSDKNREALLDHLWGQAKDLQRMIDSCRRPYAPENRGDATPMLTRVLSVVRSFAGSSPTDGSAKT